MSPLAILPAAPPVRGRGPGTRWRRNGGIAIMQAPAISLPGYGIAKNCLIVIFATAVAASQEKVSGTFFATWEILNREPSAILDRWIETLGLVLAIELWRSVAGMGLSASDENGPTATHSFWARKKRRGPF